MGHELMKEVMELVDQLVNELAAKSTKPIRFRNIAKILLTTHQLIQPMIREIQYSGVELTPHHQLQLRMFSENLENARKLSEKVLKCNRWNMVLFFKKIEDLVIFIRVQLLANVLAAVFCHLRAYFELLSDRISGRLNSLIENLGSRNLKGSETMLEAMVTGAYLGVGLDLDTRAVNEMRGFIDITVTYAEPQACPGYSFSRWSDYLPVSRLPGDVYHEYKPLRQGISQGRVDVVKSFLTNRPNAVDKWISCYETPLLKACACGKLEIVAEVLRLMTPEQMLPNMSPNASYHTPLTIRPGPCLKLGKREL